MNSQPTSHIAADGARASRDAQATRRISAADETRAIPARHEAAGQAGATAFSAQGTSVLPKVGGAPVSIAQQFSSLPTAPSRAVSVASAAPSTTDRLYGKHADYGESAPVRDPFEPSTPDPYAAAGFSHGRGAHAKQGPYDPGSTEPVATRYSENSRVKKRPRFALVVACVLALLAVVGFFMLQSGGAKSGATPAGGVTPAQSESSSSSSGSSLFTPGVSQNAATLTVDTSDLVGEKWSNAKKKLEVRGADVASIVVLTDDGKDVWDASNWTVESIAVEDGALTAHLVHDGASSVSDALESGAADAAGNALDAAGEAVKSAGQTAAEKAAEWLGSLF